MKRQLTIYWIDFRYFLEKPKRTPSLATFNHSFFGGFKLLRALLPPASPPPPPRLTHPIRLTPGLSYSEW